MSKRKKIILCLVMAAAVLAIGATFAFLSFTTGTAQNKFSSNKYLDIQLREPSWDGYDFGQYVTDSSGKQSEPDGKTPKSTDTALGYNQALHYSPGQSIPKNPQVKNTGDSTNGVDAYIAVKVTYSIGGAAKSYDDFTYKEDNNTATRNNGGITTGLDFKNGWVLVQDNGSNGQIYLYGTGTAGRTTGSSATSLGVGATTANPLFTQVPISPNVTLVPTTVNGVTENLPPAFNITVKAYAIQSANVSASDAANLLVKYIGN